MVLMAGVRLVGWVVPLILSLYFLAPLPCSSIRLAPVQKVRGPGPCDFYWYKPDNGKLVLGPTTIPVGTTCSWMWHDDNSHCVTPTKPNPEPAWVFETEINGQASLALRGFIYNHTFTIPGTYKYHCCTHQLLMRGIIIVAGGTGPGGPNPPAGPTAPTMPPPLPPVQPPPKLLKRPPPKRAPKNPPSTRPTKSPPRRRPPPPRPSPPSCVAQCKGKCWGSNGCGGSCPYPTESTDRTTDCNACCKLGRPKNVKKSTLNGCIAACIKAA